jgi:hypothetical protein
MNLPANILKALVVGVALAGATSCEKGNIKDDLGVYQCTEECQETGVHNHPILPDDICPACGMG